MGTERICDVQGHEIHLAINSSGAHSLSIMREGSLVPLNMTDNFTLIVINGFPVMLKHIPEQDIWIAFLGDDDGRQVNWYVAFKDGDEFKWFLLLVTPAPSIQALNLSISSLPPSSEVGMCS